MNAEGLMEALKAYADPDDAVFLQRFFKTAEGQYGAGDRFIGVRVPQIRRVCRQFRDLPLSEIEKLLASDIHECRLAGVVLLADQYAVSDTVKKRAIYDVYVKNVYEGRINNWDIVDASAEFIIGEYLWDKPRDLLFSLAKSENIWQRRVAVLSSFAYIKRGDSSTTLELAALLLHDPHDLIQKAVGWMLREVAMRCDEKVLTTFLEKHYTAMPRTMLRYAIERLLPEQKLYFMKK